MRIYNLNHQWLTNGTEKRRGAITLVYDYRHGELLTALTALRNSHQNIIEVSVRRAVDKNRTVEVLVVRGSGAQLRGLFDLLTTLKGTESVRITTTTLTGPQALPPCAVPSDKCLQVGSL